MFGHAYHCSDFCMCLVCRTVSRTLVHMVKYNWLCPTGMMPCIHVKHSRRCYVNCGFHRQSVAFSVLLCIAVDQHRCLIALQ